MTPWIQIYSNLPEHPKIYQLADTLETGNCEAVGVVVSLWLWAAKNAPDGISAASRCVRWGMRWAGGGTQSGCISRWWPAASWMRTARTPGSTTGRSTPVRLMEINERKKQQEYERIRRHRQRKKEREQLEQSQSKAEEAQVFPQDTEMTTEQENEISAENPVEPENTAQYAEQNAEAALCNAKVNVTCNVTKPKCNAPTGQDSTPQDKTEQYTTQPPPSGSGAGSAAAEPLIEEFRSRLGGMSPTARKELKSFLKTMEPEVCLRALDIGCDNGHPKWAYVRAILNRWRQSGVKVPATFTAGKLRPNREIAPRIFQIMPLTCPQSPQTGSAAIPGYRGTRWEENGWRRISRV